MRLFIALRLLNEHHAVHSIESQIRDDAPKGRLIDANVARRHPALKNVFSYLHSAGILPEFRRGKVLRTEAGEQQIEREADFRLYWCEIETELPAEYWYEQMEVEVVIEKEEFDRFVSSIRHKAGAIYVAACENYAKALRISEPSDLQYEPPHKSKVRAA